VLRTLAVRFRGAAWNPPSTTVTIVLVLSAVKDSSGVTWYRVRYPNPSDRGTGWIASSDAGPLQTVYTHLYVDRRSHRARLQRDGVTIFRFPVGVGAPATPTPAGQFVVEARVPLPGDPFYGPFAFKTSAATKVDTDWPGGRFMIVLHGTNEPRLIPGTPSHGEIRLRDRTMRRLARLMPVGTPLTIR
jgi:hypothetical protein